MNRQTRIIDVGGVAMLFSPVLAHSLEPGDLIATGFADMPTVRIVSTRRSANLWGPCVILRTSSGAELEEAINTSVMRAVGARAARVMA